MSGPNPKCDRCGEDAVMMVLHVVMAIGWLKGSPARKAPPHAYLCRACYEERHGPIVEHPNVLYEVD